MRFHIYTRRASGGAQSLVNALVGLGHTAERGEVITQRVDLIVNWGEGGIHNWGGAPVLNPSPTLNKQRQLQLLAEGEVSCPSSMTATTGEGIRLPRLNSHSEGRDILKCLRGEATPDFWTEFIPVLHEVRFHVFQGKSIRCGIKKAIHPIASHPYIRSHRNGWNMIYGESHLRGAGITEEVQVRARAEAKKACQVLRLDFGAVDVGIQEDGVPVVFEVNHAPGIEGRMSEIYAENIVRAAGRIGRERRTT